MKYEELRSLVGQLSWISYETRSGISIDVCQLSVDLKNAKVSDVMKANKCIKKLKNDDLGENGTFVPLA